MLILLQVRFQDTVVVLRVPGSGQRHFGLALSDSEVERVVRALRSEGLQQLASRHGDIDYPSRVLLRLARSLPALGLLAWITLRRPFATWSLLRANLPFPL